MSPAKPPIKIIANAIDLVETLASEGALSPAEAAERIGIPRSSAYRLIEGLTAIGLIEALGDGRVRLSMRWLELADAARASLPEWDGAAEVLQGLVGRTGQTAFLSVLTEDGAVCIDWCRGRGVDVLALKPGRTLPLYAGAAGRTLLAFAVDAGAYLTAAPFTPLTPATLVTSEALWADVEHTRSRGYALSEQDVSIGIDAMGVPIRAEDGSVTGAVSIGGLSDAFEGRLDEFYDELRAAAIALSRTSSS